MESDRDKLHQSITDALLAALRDSPKAAMVKVAVDFLALSESGDVPSPEDKKRRADRAQSVRASLPFPVETKPVTSTPGQTTGQSAYGSSDADKKEQTGIPLSDDEF